MQQQVEVINSLDLVDTPALLVDLDLVHANIKRLFGALSKTHVNVRPHLKTVKSEYFAKLMLNAGARGVCVAKLGEAEIMAAAGIEDILITTELAGAPKLVRLMKLLQEHPEIKIVVDSQKGANEINTAAEKFGLTIPVKTLVEINVGQNRCGVEPGAPALDLARHITALRHLKFVGVQGYEGHIQMLGSDSERESSCLEAMGKLISTVKLLKAAGLTPEIVSTGGTGTSEICARFPEVTEVQPGSFVFWDVAYRNAIGNTYANALTVVATVISKPFPNRAVVDAGMKSLSTDSGSAELKGHANISYRAGGDEHGIIESADGPLPFDVGDRVEFIPSHIDTTVNLHDVYHCHRSGVALELHAISARGKVQ